MRTAPTHMPCSRQHGMTLVELMIAMLLGLVVVGGAVSLTLANRRSHSTNEGLSQVQESARTAFELLARDIRQAGVSGCDNTGRISNVLTPSGFWWQDWFGLRGYDDEPSTGVAYGAARGQRVDDTDTIQTQGIDGQGLSVLTHDPATATMQINAPSTDIAAGDVMIACDFDHATIFRVTAYNAANVALTHGTGGPAPSNCFAGLGFSTPSCAADDPYEFLRNSLVARFSATEWYIGHSGRTTDSGRSLFRTRLGLANPEEVVADVTDMQITYRVDGTDDFVPANHVSMSTAAWQAVNAVRIALVMNSADSLVSTDADNAGRLERRYDQVIALRNRLP